MSRRMRLSVLADGLFAVPADADRDIHGLCADSRRINDGDAFLAVPGLSAHGLEALAAASTELAGHHHELVREQRLARDPRLRVTRQEGVEDAVRDPVSELVGVALGYGFRGEKAVAYEHVVTPV